MPVSWGLREVLLAIFLVGVPLSAVIGGVRRWLRDAAAARQQRHAEREREELRCPLPGSLDLTGQVVATEPPLVLVVRRKFGCLGGPIVFGVPPFTLREDDGASYHVEVGPDPVVHQHERLAPARCDRPEDLPLPSGAPEVFLMAGRVRVQGVLLVGPGRLAPPRGYSATLTLVADA